MSTPGNTTPHSMSTVPTMGSIGTSDSDPSSNQLDQMVLRYLRTRGLPNFHKSLESALGEDSAKVFGSNTVDQDELGRRLTIFAQPPKTGTSKETLANLQDLGALGNNVTSQAAIQSLIVNVGPTRAEEIVSLDPQDRHEGFRELEAWVDGSLEMYRQEFRPILFPIFCHFYLDLIHSGYKDAALHFFWTFSSTLAATHSGTLHHLSTLQLPTHIQNDTLAQRFRSEKYLLRMSKSGFSLLIGWLTDGVSGEGLGGGNGFGGDLSKRGRASVMRIVNNHLRFDVNNASTSTIPRSFWEGPTGFVSAQIPQETEGQVMYDPQAFNRSKGELKLGPPPISDDLREESERVIREQAMIDRDLTAQYDPLRMPTPSPGLVTPSSSDIPPYPQTFTSTDVKREVEKARDARKRIKLEPTGHDHLAPHGSTARARSLPSICMYTFLDSADSIPCCTFSPDLSLLAAGSSESYIRLWSLTGEKLKAVRNDLDPQGSREPLNARKLREKGSSSTRNLIGHSAPVTSVSFDPTGGSAIPPRYLLSSSADSTARLWSLDAMTNVFSYRGHQNPVWDVQWSPMGIYFATASRDRTARLWSTDRPSTLRIYAGHSSDVDLVRFHPNSMYLATGSSDRTCRLWDVQRGTCVRVFLGHQAVITAMALSPDGRYLASASEDLAIHLWDLGSGRRIKKMTGHHASIYTLAFSAESSVLVSGSADWTVRCWDVKSSWGEPKQVNGNANGVIPNLPKGKPDTILESTDLIDTFATKRTSTVNLQFTARNLCLAAGSMLSFDGR